MPSQHSIQIDQSSKSQHSIQNEKALSEADLTEAELL